MLARQFIKPSLQATLKAEIITIKRKHFPTEDGVIEPLVEHDFNGAHPAAAGHAFNYSPIIDEAEALADAMAIGGDVRFDACSGQALEGESQEVVIMTAGMPVGRHQQVISLEAHGAAYRPALVHSFDKLTDGVDENVFVPDGRNAEHTGCNGDALSVVVIMPNSLVGSFRQAEERMLH